MRHTLKGMRAPVIGISGTRFGYGDGPWAGYLRSSANDDYVQGVRAAGGTPIILPLVEDEVERLAGEMVAALDGLVLTGGEDVAPARYGQERREVCGEPFVARDAWDFALYAAARRRGIPILGICRGMQLITVAEGGTMHQDLSEDPRIAINHMQCDETPELDALWHPVDVAPGSLVGRVLGPDRVQVNSFHHQAVATVPESLRVTAVSDDHVVEAVELAEPDAWLLGVQWHPERSFRHDARAAAVFAALVEAARA